MKQLSLVLSSFLFFSAVNAQSHYQEVYSLFQTNCATASCHASASSAGGLDLEGVGASIADQEAAVYNNIYKTTPNNTFAAAKNNYTVYPGDPYRSFLLRKISNGFSDDNPIDANEGDVMTHSGTLGDYEKEVIRQWIVFGAKETGMEVDLALVDDYYTNGGVESVPLAPAPPSSDGFQVHLGPFFIPPLSEVEYLSKYETLLDETVEIVKFQTEMGTLSHHFIVYNFTDDLGAFDPGTLPYGMREDIDFDGKNFVLTEQYSNTLSTPEGTAFKWDANTVLDLNSHYDNRSGNSIVKCDVYLNIHTQENGTAAQEMHTLLIPNTDIEIPNNSQEVTFVSPFSLPSDLDVFIWGSVAHTHQFGTDFNIFKRNIDGSRGDQVYDAGCGEGVPGCAVEGYDYKHLPFRFFEPFMPINLQEGVIAEAKYLNDGPVPLEWGLTAADEMMLFIIFFTTDTTGVSFPNGPTTSIQTPTTSFGKVAFYPNPVGELANLTISEIPIEASTLKIIDINGKVCESLEFMPQDETTIPVDAKEFSNGIYFYHIIQANNSIAKGKFVVNK